MTLIIDHSEKRKPPYLVYTYDDDFTLDPEDIIDPDDIPAPSNSNPVMDGTAAIGSSLKYARADHVHPSDTGKANAVHTHAAADIVSGTLDAARIPSLDAAKIGSGTLDAARIPSLDAAKIGSGTLDAARIPSLDAAKIGSGTLDAARIPSLDAAKIASGILPTSRGGTGSSNFMKDGVLEKIQKTANLSVASSTWKSGGSFTLGAGIYFAIIHTEWASNVNGIRMHSLVTSDPEDASFSLQTNGTATVVQSASGSTSVLMRLTSVAFLTPTAETTYYLALYQTTGSALNCSARRVRVIQLI